MNERPEVKQIINALRTAIKGDRRYFVKASVDSNFDLVRKHVDNLLSDLTAEARDEAENELSATASVLDKAEKWHTNDMPDHNSARESIRAAEARFQSGTYFGYLDAKSLAKEAQRRANLAINAKQTNMRQIIDHLKTKCDLLTGPGGDFGNHDVKHFALPEYEAALELEKEGSALSRNKDYLSYEKSRIKYEECLRLGCEALEKTLISSEKSEYRALNAATILVVISLISPIPLFYLTIVLWNVLLGLVAFASSPILLALSNFLWDWDRLEPPKRDMSLAFLFIIFGPLAMFWCLCDLGIYFESRRGIAAKSHASRKELRIRGQY